MLILLLNIIFKKSNKHFIKNRYELTAICDSAQACISALLGDQIAPVSEEEITRKPAPIAVNLLNRVIQIQCKWSKFFRLSKYDLIP